VYRHMPRIEIFPWQRVMAIYQNAAKLYLAMRISRRDRFKCDYGVGRGVGLKRLAHTGVGGRTESSRSSIATLQTYIIGTHETQIILAGCLT
jgi:hypothetical protein